jgi:hypothetical protein
MLCLYVEDRLGYVGRKLVIAAAHTAFLWASMSDAVGQLLALTNPSAACCVHRKHANVGAGEVDTLLLGQDMPLGNTAAAAAAANVSPRVTARIEVRCHGSR